MIDRREEFPHIAFEHPALARVILRGFAEKILESLHCLMRSFSITARIRIGYEPAIEEGIELAIERMMEQAVAHERLMDIPRLRIGNLKGVVASMPVSPFLELAPQLEDVIHEPVLEFLNILLLPLAPDEFLPCREQVFQRNDILIAIMDKILPVIEHLLGVYKIWYGFRDCMPKKSRYTLGDKIDSRFLSVLELLYIASYQSAAQKLPVLEKALTGVDTLKFLLRLAWEVRVFDEKKYAALSEGLNEAGRQIGGWRRGLQTKTSAQK